MCLNLVGALHSYTNINVSIHYSDCSNQLIITVQQNIVVITKDNIDRIPCTDMERGFEHMIRAK